MDHLYQLNHIILSETISCVFVISGGATFDLLSHICRTLTTFEKQMDQHWLIHWEKSSWDQTLWWNSTMFQCVSCSQYAWTTLARLQQIPHDLLKLSTMRLHVIFLATFKEVMRSCWQTMFVSMSGCGCALQSCSQPRVKGKIFDFSASEETWSFFYIVNYFRGF